MFVNRTVELDALERWWRSRAQPLAVVWGRRRVGKTALVRRFADGRRAIVHTGAGRAEGAELAMLAAQIPDAPGSRAGHKAPAHFRDWDDALDHLAGLAVRSPLLLVLDEFPELAASTPELPNVLRAFLDRAAGATKLRILLCGSAVRYMEQLTEARNPLHGRADLTLQVHPFQPWEAALMLRDLSPAQRAVVYGIVGGTPLYLGWWEQNATVAENLAELAGAPGARLLTEGELVLSTEAETGGLARAALHAIAAGATRHNEVQQAIRADPTRLLERLAELRLIERQQPVTETGRTRRRTYRIADNFLAFYLDVLGRHRTQLENGLGPGIMPVITDALDDHQGGRWEAAVRSHIRRAAAAGEFGERIVAVGPFWTTDGHNEIDVVALAGRSRAPVLVAEAKWARQVSAPGIVAALLRKAAALPDAAADLQVAVCARERVTDLPDGVLAITASDVFT
ncbi:MAG: ATP-binding protein [Sporichthyaceae bacterium]